MHVSRIVSLFIFVRWVPCVTRFRDERRIYVLYCFITIGCNCHASPSAADFETAIRLDVEDGDIELTDIPSGCSIRAHFE